ncbi:penicillin-binding transpeptidase domain-containing protein [Geotalea sp. SG265]|uniref:penicillin-binding transpeptidase domain-containing protein n=1 Tax=Geotalea sp. SG265 TaxID=2922867 RepID=UPI001FAF94AE|nr:penicillin-binding transpeptidase domain-containing protein [Geotalea sp. SG265]
MTTRKQLIIATTVIVAIGITAWLFLPGSPIGKHIFVRTKPPARPQLFRYASLTSLDLFRYLCTTSGLRPSPGGDLLLQDGNMAHLSLQRNLQEEVRAFMEKRKVPYAVFVAIEPKTGRVLASVAHSSLSPEWENRAPFSGYPMASLFKVVTAAAAFQTGKANALTPIHFRGGATSESPSRWGRPGRGGDAAIPLCNAMAHSVNPAFGRLAEDCLDPATLSATARQFGFGTYPFGGNFIAMAELPTPTTDGELMRMAAGLDHKVRISPFQVAMIFAALGNGGTMPTPSLVDAIQGPGGKELYRMKPAPLAAMTSPHVAAELLRAMSQTVASGTAKTAFRDAKGRRYHQAIPVAGKTGSIVGFEPRGHYNWFAGVAPANDPQIAFVALTINGDMLRLRAPQLGRAALDIFFANKR